MDIEDRSEKIITLARTILAQPTQPPPQTYSLKTVVLAALISASVAGTGSAALVGHARPLNYYEKTEIQALIYYAAKIRHCESDGILEDLYHQFAIHTLDELTRAQLPDVRLYLYNIMR